MQGANAGRYELVFEKVCPTPATITKVTMVDPGFVIQSLTINSQFDLLKQEKRTELKRIYMGDHYIPQSYLQGFAEPPRYQYIYMYTKGDSRCVRTNIKNVAQENKLYSEDVESFFANTIETPTKPILEKIKSHQNISSKERKVFVQFLIATLRRVPSHKELLQKWFKENSESYFNQLDEDIKGLLKTHPDKESVLRARLNELQIVRKENRIKPEDIWYKTLVSTTLPNLSLAIENMTWMFLITKEDSFMTSDNPIFLFRQGSIENTSSEITFPISSKIALWMTWQNKSCEGFRVAKENFIIEINRRTVRSATKYIFFPMEKDWIINLINKSTIQLRALKRLCKN